MKIINISDAEANFLALVEQVQSGKSIIIGKAGTPVAMLVPYHADTTPRKLSGGWKGKVTIADDFDSLPDGMF